VVGGSYKPATCTHSGSPHSFEQETSFPAEESDEWNDAYDDNIDSLVKMKLVICL